MYVLKFFVGEMGQLSTMDIRCRANMAHIRQSMPDSGLFFQVKKLEPFEIFNPLFWKRTVSTVLLLNAGCVRVEVLPLGDGLHVHHGHPLSSEYGTYKIVKDLCSQVKDLNSF